MDKNLVHPNIKTEERVALEWMNAGNIYKLKEIYIKVILHYKRWSFNSVHLEPILSTPEWLMNTYRTSTSSNALILPLIYITVTF